MRPSPILLYLITPPRIAEASFPGLLSELLDQVPIAAVRMELETRDEEIISRTADGIRGICHAHDVPLTIADHYRVVRRLGLDGVHLKGTKDVRDARKELGDNAIVGTYCGTSRHAGMTAGEIGADYVSFGTLEAAKTLAPFTDFIALGAEVWNGDMPPVEVLKAYAAQIKSS